MSEPLVAILDDAPPLDLPAPAAEIERRGVSTLGEAALLGASRPVLLLCGAGALAAAPPAALDALSACVAIVGVGAELPPDAVTRHVVAWVWPGAPEAHTRLALRGALRHAAALFSALSEAENARHRAGELAELARVGASLTTERDLGRLLGSILAQARRLANADAGSIYLAELPGPDGRPTRLRFKHAQNQSIPDLPLTEFTVPVSPASVAGYVAGTGELVALADVYRLPPGTPYSLNRSFDERFGYVTRSMLAIPLRTHRDETVGVLQLINRKRGAEAVIHEKGDADAHVVPFGQRDVELVTALASQAAVAIENSRLYESIERLFEGFVTAAVTAIESRDPATSGHSSRVARLTVGLAESVMRGGEGPYRGLAFAPSELRELRYAALLHDFGKVGVREQVLVKEKKLHPGELAQVRQRLVVLRERAEREFAESRAAALAAGSGAWDDVAASHAARRQARLEELQRMHAMIVAANEPTVLPEGSFEALRALTAERYVDFDGTERPLLEEDELRFLMLRRGNLDERERREIESHVTHSYRFLRQIPWTRELDGVPELAWAHHEKLDGSGYPRQLRAEQIPVQVRMMTIADIFDALTATDRPYKRAVPVHRALDILHAEARGGMLDPLLLKTFVDARVYDALRGSGAWKAVEEGVEVA